MEKFLSYFLISVLLSIPFAYALVYWFKRKVESKINSTVKLEISEANIDLLENPNPFPGFEYMKSTKDSKIKSGNFTPILVLFLLSSLSINFTRIYYEGDFYFVQSLLVQLALSLPIIYFYFLLETVSFQTKKKLILYSSFLFLSLILFAAIYSHQSFFLLLFSFVYLYATSFLLILFISAFRYIREIIFAILPNVMISVFALFAFVNYFLQNEQQLRNTFNPIYNLLQFVHLENHSALFIVTLVCVMFISMSFFLAFIVRFLFIRKLLNARILIMDIVWLIQIVFSISGTTFGEDAWIIVIALFLFYKIAQFLIFKFAKLNDKPKTLLVLRVFSLGIKSDALFRKIRKWWRTKGPIKLIAGYDLTTSLIDLDDLLVFLSGKMKNRFCTSHELIKQNLHKMDVEPDMNGDYRVNEMYCTNSTWKLILHQLITDVDCVIMDIRSFSKINAGCAHEIKALVHEVDFSKLLFIVDKTTSHDFFNSCIIEAWQRMPQDSPNWKSLQTKVRLVNYESASDFNALIQSIA